MNTPMQDRSKGFADRYWWLLLVLLPGIWALFARPLTPLEETRAAGVAWEMWLRGDFLVPHMNGVPYSHKPPLIFWLIHLGWSVFGVNDWWPRLVGPLATLAGTVLTWRLAGGLYPHDRRVRQAAAWLMAGSLGWVVYGQMLMYDALLTTCVLLALTGLWRAGSRPGPGGWILMAIGLGLAVLAKGPVALVHVVAPALLGPVWSEGARKAPLRWYVGVLLGTAGGLLIAGTWALLAAVNGGDEYARAILLEQTSGRVVQSFAHERPWWVYLVFVPALALPWVLIPSTWKSLWQADGSGSRRFLLCWIIGSLFVLSLVSGKQPHYAVPELPAVMILIAAGLAGRIATSTVAIRAVATVIILLSVGSVAFWKLHAEFDMAPAGRLAASLQESGVPVATMQGYKNQLAFPGRLQQPLPELERSDLKQWFSEHPNGVVITFRDELPESAGLRVFERFHYRRGYAEFWKLDKPKGLGSE
ncbi:MAG: glycosyltransferase family 39 protein [Lysobacterales bacterium]|jgi:4-amino-4-deoxy-L-arabinose transferase-like glycosyltransferase